MLVTMEDYLAHVGVSVKDGAPGPGSGRYPLGSGDRPYQNYKDFKNRLLYLRSQGVTDQKELANYFGMTIREYREQVTLANAAIERERASRARTLKDQGYSEKEIANMIGTTKGNVEKYLENTKDLKFETIDRTKQLLKESLESGGYVDVGKNVELLLGVSRTNFDAALRDLQNEGYLIQPLSIRQQFGEGNTKYSILTKPDVTKKELYDNSNLIHPPIDIKVDKDGNKAVLRPIENVDSKRISVRYAEDGGIDKDGLIEIRRGVKDLSLGESHYAQVRIGVDGTHFIKGMAVYADDLPEGIDIRFNTNKTKGTPLMSKDGGKEVLKPMKHPDDPTNPFGASIKIGMQYGAVNIVNEEGSWDKWSKNLSSQFLSKQNPSLADKQLKLAVGFAKEDLDEIKSLTNPTIKRYLLEKFADSADSDAVHLKAAALPRQANKVLLPMTTLKDNEAYAPTFDNGEQIALIRHPHGGIFEIPVLTVNNKNKEGKSLMGNARDAIGINSRTAGILSGADFDGDTVVAIPLKSARIKSLSPEQIDANPKLKNTLGTLRDFDPKKEFPGDGLPESKLMKDKNKGSHMGAITNLITDMSIKGASPEDLTKAVKYSMVVIDAPKHKLDYQRAKKELGINELVKKYTSEDYGGKTIVSQAKSPVYVPQTKEVYSKSSMTDDERKRWEQGEIIYRPTNKKKYNGELVTVKSNKMREARSEEDVYKLTSGGSKQNTGTVVEKYYAQYATSMKQLANDARKELRQTKRAPMNSSAAKTYATEVESLKAALEIAKMNDPKERQAQAIANSTVNAWKSEHADYDKDDLKKIKSRALADAREVTSAGKKQIVITDNEWKAIQAGAISDTSMEVILKNSDIDRLRELAMPKGSKGISDAKISRAQSMLDRGYTWNEVAKSIGCSVSTLERALEPQS